MSTDDDRELYVSNSGKRKSNKKLKAELIQMRRDKCLELYMSGKSEVEISEILHVSQPTISIDLKTIKENNKVTIQNIINELPLAWAKARKALQHIQTEALEIANHEKTNIPQKIQALTLFKESQESEFELITNSEILNDAFRYVEAHSKTITNLKEVLDQREKERKQQQQQQQDKDLIDDSEEEIEHNISNNSSENKEAA